MTPFHGETTGKYPEYDLMWKDGELSVVAVFGLIDGIDLPTDAGVIEYDNFITRTHLFTPLRGATKQNGVSVSVLRDTTITGTVDVGGQRRPVKIDVLLVNDLWNVRADFDSRYDALTENADVIMYSGHAGLGKNIAAMARKGKVTPGKYQFVLLNGCQTFAYIDPTINERRTEANGPAVDPQGTKFMDIMGNALPGSSATLASMSVAVIDAAMRPDAPRSFNQILDDMPHDQLVVVFGEEDNQFSPSK